MSVYDTTALHHTIYWKLLKSSIQASKGLMKMNAFFHNFFDYILFYKYLPVFLNQMLSAIKYAKFDISYFELSI